MLTPTKALIDYLQQRDLSLDRRYLRDAIHTLTQAIMESEVSQMLDAARYERNDARRAYRNGYRQSLWSTPAGDIQLHIPKLRKGTYYPHFLNDSAAAQLLELAQSAYVMGAQFADVEAALQALTANPLYSHDIADITQRLDDVVYNAQHGSLRADYPYLLLDVVDIDRADRSRWRQFALVFGIQADGHLDLLAHELTADLDESVWIRLLRTLRKRGLMNPQAVVSEDFPGVRRAVETELVDAVWEHQRYFRQRVENTEVVNAVSNLYIPIRSDRDNLPHMQWISPLPEYEFTGEYLLFVVA